MVNPHRGPVTLKLKVNQARQRLKHHGNGSEWKNDNVFSTI